MDKEVKNEDLKIELRTLTKDDYLGLKTSMVEAYSDWDGASFWKESHINKLIKIFPEGQICILVNGAIAGCALSLIVDYDQ
ncbi:MAG TPA: carbon-nitrogen hydrolase, partial [Daejeonella sp.]|nr:carbon-nitrogen hydrolase [Daejeonella sp.]